MGFVYHHAVCINNGCGRHCFIELFCWRVNHQLFKGLKHIYDTNQGVATRQSCQIDQHAINKPETKRT